MCLFVHNCSPISDRIETSKLARRGTQGQLPIVLFLCELTEIQEGETQRRGRDIAGFLRL